MIAIASQKGGVGKTTTAINLGTALAAVGKQTLLIDIDPQGNASTGLGHPAEQRDLSTYDLLLEGADPARVAVETGVPGLLLLPASVDLSGFDLETYGKPRQRQRLRDALEAADGYFGRFDYVLIDCPPTLTMLTLNAMVAADAVMVPLECEFFALEGLSQILRTVEQVRGNLNLRLELLGVVLTKFDVRNNLSAQVEADARAYLKGKVYDTVIPRNVRISEAPSHGQPVLIYDHRCAGSQAYIRLAAELLRRERSALVAA